jgi:hypothetical protein
MLSAILQDVTRYKLLPDYMVSVTSQKIALSMNQICYILLLLLSNILLSVLGM